MTIPPEQRTVVNAVKSIFFPPCAVPTLIYVETFVEAIFKLGYSYAYPDIRELITETTGKGIICHIEGGIHDAEILDPILSDGKQKALFTVVKGLDLATFYYFVMMLVRKELIQASTPFMNGKICDPNSGAHNGWGNWPISGDPAGGGWHFTPIFRSPLWPDGQDGSNEVLIPPGCSRYITHGWTPVLLGSGAPVPCQEQIFIRESGEVIADSGIIDGKEGNSSVIMHGKYYNNTGGSVWMQSMVRYFDVPPSARVVADPHGQGASGYFRGN